jgi:hypothetical protein
MRVDYEDLELYMKLDHHSLEPLLADNFSNNIDYFNQVGRDIDWFYKSSPYYIYEVLKTRNTGFYEIIYDYIKRRVTRKNTVFDYGAGIGSMEVLLLKRSPSLLTAYEPNLLCLDFVHWRVMKRGGDLSPRIEHYDNVISIDMLQRLDPDLIKPTLNWLLSLGDRCFIYVVEDTRHPLYNKLPFNIGDYLESVAQHVENYHGLWDVIMHERE